MVFAAFARTSVRLIALFALAWGRAAFGGKWPDNDHRFSKISFADSKSLTPQTPQLPLFRPLPSNRETNVPERMQHARKRRTHYHRETRQTTHQRSQTASQPPQRTAGDAARSQKPVSAAPALMPRDLVSTARSSAPPPKSSQSSRNTPPTYAPNSRPSAPRKAFLVPPYRTTCSELTGFARLRQGYSPADSSQHRLHRRRPSRSRRRASRLRHVD